MITLNKSILALIVKVFFKFSRYKIISDTHTYFVCAILTTNKGIYPFRENEEYVDTDVNVLDHYF